METNIHWAAGVIVKSDQTGRTRYIHPYKLELVAASEFSSLSASIFARQCGIKYPTLAAWIGGAETCQSKRIVWEHPGLPIC